MDPPPKQGGLFSSLSLGRASRSPKPSETLTHPLLGASSSTLNLATTDEANNLGHSRSGSWSKTSGTPPTGSASGSTNASSGDVPNPLPYKPRQRHAHQGSSSSVSSFTTGGNAPSPTLHPTSSATVSTSPVTPTAVVAPATTSTSTSTTFALPPLTTDTPSSDPSSTAGSSSSATATVRLQQQSLKAAAQRIGLGNGSMGMTMLDAIFDKGQIGRAKPGEGGDWGEVLRTLIAGKAVLLLPMTPSSSLPMTPQTLRDHIAFLSPPIPVSEPLAVSRKSSTSSLSDKGKAAVHDTVTMVVTMSGLVGVLKDNAVTFESSLTSDSALLTAIRDSTNRSAALSSLRPVLPFDRASTSQPYPLYSLSPDSASLPFPPLGKGSTNHTLGEPKDKEKERPAAGKLARINPFASLFGPSTPAASSPPAVTSPGLSSSPSKLGGTLTPDRPASPAAEHASPSVASPRPSLLSIDVPENASIMSDASASLGEGFQVTAYTVSKPIRLAEVQKTLSKATRSYVKDELARIPDKVAERVCRLVAAGIAPSSSASGPDFLKSHGSDDPAVTIDFSNPAAAGEKLQDFMEAVYDDLLVHYRADSSHLFAENGGLKRKTSGTVPWSRGSMSVPEEDEEVKRERKDRLRREKDDMAEKAATEGTEKVEAVVCRLLYNYLFSPLESDDARHDEALASRIAALNLLDLSLDHLGLITEPEDEQDRGAIAAGLAGITDRTRALSLIDAELQRLSTSTCLTPKDKADILIKAHKLVVGKSISSVGSIVVRVAARWCMRVSLLTATDGLAELPPIDLRPEGEPYKPSPRPQSPMETTPRVEKAEPSVIVDQPSVPDEPVHGLRITTGASDDGLHSEDRLSSDPLATKTDADESTPLALQASPERPVPHLILTESADTEATSPSAESPETARLQEAMTDSVLTVHAEPLSRDTSKSSQVSTSAEKPRGTSGADLILPIIIFAVVKANPPQLASQLMYLRRYRSAICLTGEASYALVNLTAVVEFLEHVDLAELGLGGDSDKVISIADLSPIGLDYLDESNADAASIASASSRLRGRVFQVGELAGSAAGSANKVITGVIDSSWTAVRGLISNNNAPSAPSQDEEAAAIGSRPGMRPRQASTFSLASVTASVANIAAAAAASTSAARNRSRASSRASEQVQAWGANQELMEVSSRPESIREVSDYPSSAEEDEAEEDDVAGRGAAHQRTRSDARSIRSVSSMMSKEGRREERDKERVSLSDRLANIGVLGRLGSEAAQNVNEPTPTPAPAPTSKPSGFLANLTSGRSASVSSSTLAERGHASRGSLLGQVDPAARPRAESVSPAPSGSPANLPSTLASVDPPMERYMTCEVGELRLSEIGVLLRDYRRLGAAVNSFNAKLQDGAH